MGTRILLVEIDSDLAGVEKDLLQRHDFEVVAVDSIKEALEAMARHADISLFLIGIEKKGASDGTEIAQLLLEQRELPVVFLSDHTEKEYLKKASAVPHQGYVLRSSGEFVLADTIRTALRMFHHQNTTAEYLRITLRSIGDGVISTDRRGNVVEMNPAAENLTGWGVASARGRALEEVFQIRNSFTGEKVDNPIRQVLDTGEATNLANHTKLISKNGREYHIADSAAPITDDEEHLRGVVLVFRDVTEIYEKDRQLRERIKELNCLYRISEIVETPDITLKDILQKTAETLPPSWLHPEEACARISLEGSSYLSGDFQTSPWKQSADILLYGKKAGVIEVFYRMEKPELDESPFLEEEQKLLEAVAERLGRIIERKRSKEALDHSLVRLEETNRLARMGLWSWDRKTDTVSWSKELYEIAGLDPAFPAPTYAEHPNIYSEKSWKKLREAVERALSTGEAYKVELELIRPDGEIRSVLVHGGARMEEAGDISGLYGTVQDITDRKEIEENLKKALEEKTFLMKELNHRVKNNLTIIASLISLKDQELGDSVDLSDIRHQIDAIRIIHEKLHRSDRIQTIDVREYFQDLLDTFFSTFTRRGEVVFEQDIEDLEIPAGTAVPLGLIVNELATNAVKHGFLPAEEARFGVKLHRDPEGDQCVLHISNSGNPFPAEVNIHSSDSLGLQLVVALVDQIHGDIEVHSEPHTVFTLRFKC